MVITVTGILAAMVAIFIRAPIDAYVDSARRADLSTSQIRQRGGSHASCSRPCQAAFARVVPVCWD